MAWYVTDGSQEFGPYTDDTMRAVAASGKWVKARYVNEPSQSQPTISQPMQAIPIAAAVQPAQQSGGNVIAAIASFFVPGLGQLAQGRLIAGVLAFIAAVLMWAVFLGWIIHIASAIDAAGYKP